MLLMHLTGCYYTRGPSYTRSPISSGPSSGFVQWTEEMGAYYNCQVQAAPLFATHRINKSSSIGIQTVTARALPEGSSKQSSNNKDSFISGNSGTIVSACAVGVLTGVSVVLFNNGVHEIRDLFWDGIPSRGASWLREAPLEATWTRVILVPAFGGFTVSILNAIGSTLPERGSASFIQPFLKAIAACFTLGTGNSLGPEGPSVEIGTSIAKGVASLTPSDDDSQLKLSLLAAGSAAGLSSGFNAAVAGCFFAVESVLWPSPGNSSASLTNTTSMVILSAVIASVVSEVGLGSEPSFTVPEYDFRSFAELPLYLLLGVFCGLVSLLLSRCTSTLLMLFNNLHNNSGIPRAVFPVMGGLATGMIALAYPEILYWGFENVDILLESRPFVDGLSAELLLQLVGIKILAASLCRATGLVGGYYAPSLFIGAATGMAYGKLINSVVALSDPTLPLSFLEVASPQAYGLVGMAATLAGVCQVPLTSVLLLFELTQDYRIVLPLLGAVGLSSWITSGQPKRLVKENISVQPTGVSSDELGDQTAAARKTDLCELENSLCISEESFAETELPRKKIRISEAMRKRYVTVLMNTSLAEALTRLLDEKQSCAMIVDENNTLVGLLTLGEIEDFSKRGKAGNRRSEELLVSEMCSSDDKNCRVRCTAYPGMDLLSLQLDMNKSGVSHVPVISDNGGNLVGLIDKECIDVTCRALATRELLDDIKPSNLSDG